MTELREGAIFMKGSESKATIEEIEERISEHKKVAYELIRNDPGLYVELLVDEVADKMREYLAEPAAKWKFPNLKTNNVKIARENDTIDFFVKGETGRIGAPLETSKIVFGITTKGIVETASSILLTAEEVFQRLRQLPLGSDRDSKVQFVAVDPKNKAFNVDEPVDKNAEAGMILRLMERSGSYLRPFTMTEVKNEGYYEENLFEEGINSIEESFEPWLGIISTGSEEIDQSMRLNGNPTDDPKMNLYNSSKVLDLRQQDLDLLMAFRNKADELQSASIMFDPGSFGQKVRKHIEILLGGSFAFCAPTQQAVIILPTCEVSKIMKLKIGIKKGYENAPSPVIKCSEDAFISENGVLRRIEL